MSEKETKILSFVGGLVFFTVVAGVLISQDDKIREEIKEQANSLLKTSKKVLQQLQYVVTKVSKLTSDVKSDKQNSNIEDKPATSSSNEYDSLWEQAEQQNVAVLQNRS
jgi:hypothetical protein